MRIERQANFFASAFPIIETSIRLRDARNK